jgi:hypothetical protein
MKVNGLLQISCFLYETTAQYGGTFDDALFASCTLLILDLPPVSLRN